MLISPTERDLASMGTVSSIPEKWGCDVLIRTPVQWVGVQRKAIPDLIASVHDGRLTRELGQMDACQRLGVKVVVVEGEPTWTVDGVLAGKGFGAQWTRAQHHGLLWSVRARGVWVDTTRNVEGTRMWLRMFESWVAKERHTSLERRPNVRGVWGVASGREFGVHMYQGLPGVGPELAGRLFDEFGLAWQWSISEAALQGVKGVGKKRARQLWESLATVGCGPDTSTGKDMDESLTKGKEAPSIDSPTQRCLDQSPRDSS